MHFVFSINNSSKRSNFLFCSEIFFVDQFQLMFCARVQSLNFLSMKISWLMRSIQIIARLLNSIRSHWLIKSLKIYNNVFFLWSINEYTQLKKINSSLKCAMNVVSSNVLLQMIKSKCNIWKDIIVFADDVRWIRRCIFEIAHVSQWTIFEAFFWIISISSILFNWLIIFDQQCFNRKCQFLKIVFVLNCIDELFDESIFQQKQVVFFLNVVYHYIDWFDHQCFLVHVSYKILLLKTSYEHQDNVNKWHINDVIEEHSSILFVDAIDDEHRFIFFDQHEIVWCIDHFVRKRHFIYESIQIINKWIITIRIVNNASL
jgi:hypothetical protein